jgi:site-specific recombinase XerD
VSGYENFIGGAMFLTSIKPRNAEAFIANRLASGLAVASVNKDIRTLKRIFNLAIEPRGYLAEGQNPFAKIKQRKKSLHPIRYVSVKGRDKAGTWNTVCEVVNNIGRSFETTRKRYGIAKCSTIHDLRRSAITNWAKHLPIQVVQQFAGHSDISTTRKYYLQCGPKTSHLPTRLSTR